MHGPRFAAHGTVSLNPETFGAIGLEGLAEREWWTCGLRGFTKMLEYDSNMIK